MTPNLEWLIERACHDAGLDVPTFIEVWRAFDARFRAVDGLRWTTTHGQRKAWDGEPDLSVDGWFPYSSERFDYHEEILWFRTGKP